MSKLHLIIGNKNYSSWSLRPWMAMTMADIPFKETVVPLYLPETKAAIEEHSKAGRVPVLHHGKLVIWDSLAILEYLAETFPEKKLWPVGKTARAVARSICKRNAFGLCGVAQCVPHEYPSRSPKPVALARRRQSGHRTVSRMIWRGCREKFGKGGPFLFGKFSIAGRHVRAGGQPFFDLSSLHWR